MPVSVLLRHGVGCLTEIECEIREGMEPHDGDSVAQYVRAIQPSP